MPKRTHKEVWRALVDEAGADEVDRAASVSVEQAEKELTAMGFDIAAERARAAAFLDELEHGNVDAKKADVNGSAGVKPAPKVVPTDAKAGPRRAATPTATPVLGPAASGGPVPAGQPRRLRRGVVLLAAAVVLGAAAAYAARTRIARLFSHDVQVVPSAVPPSPAERASKLCDNAVDACRAKDWDACAKLADQALEKDPSVTSDPRYVRVRWAVDMARTQGPQFPWIDKPIGPGVRPSPEVSSTPATPAPEKPTLPTVPP